MGLHNNIHPWETARGDRRLIKVRHAECNEGPEPEVRKHLVGRLATVESDSEQIDEDYLVGAVQPTLKPVRWSDIKRAAGSDSNYQDLVRQVRPGFPQSKAELPENFLAILEQEGQPSSGGKCRLVR